MSSPPSLSVLLVQHGRTELTARAVVAVDRSSYTGTVEILVYDNASAEGVGEVASLPGVRVVRGDRNLGFGPATNRLAEEASGDLILLLNNDTLVSPSCLERMVARLARKPEAGAIAPQFRWFDGTVLEIGGFVGDVAEGWQLFRGSIPPRSFRGMSYRADYGSAACLLLRRELFLGCGGFDDVFAPAYYEDTDLCFRLADQGRRIVVEPSAVVYHLDGGTSGGDEDPTGPKRLLARKNRGRFLQRWARVLKARGPANFGAALRGALTERPEQPLVLWLMPDFLKPDQSGGHARVAREISALRDAGIAVAIWCEHLGDSDRYGPQLEAAGVAWFGYKEATRWLSSRRQSCLDSLQALLALDAFDVVVAWGAELADRLGPLVRALAPRARFLVDSPVLHYRQHERGSMLGLDLSPDLHAPRVWELGVYRSADAVIASSQSEAAELDAELPRHRVTSYDVGAYEPRPSSGNGEEGSLLFLGNFVHPPNFDAVAWWMREIAPRAEELAGTTIRLRVVGNASEVLADRLPPSPYVDIVGWVEQLDQELGRARAFAVPLRYGAGTKDKISIALRYGLPTLTTSVGAEDMPAVLRASLLVADSAQEFARLVVRLMKDRPFWLEQAAGARRAAAGAWQAQRATDREFGAWFTGLLARTKA